MVGEALHNQFTDLTSHAYRVKDLTFQFIKTATVNHLQAFTLSPREARMVSNAASLHDIGKLLTPPGILEHSHDLTEEEEEKLRLHTVDGAMLLYFSTAYQHTMVRKYAFEIALHHHERIDGNGYPDGLKDADLAPWLQVASLADALAALTEDRGNRPAQPPEEAWAMILRGQFGTFDDRLLRCLDSNQSGWMPAG